MTIDYLLGVYPSIVDEAQDNVAWLALTFALSAVAIFATWRWMPTRPNAFSGVWTR